MVAAIEVFVLLAILATIASLISIAVCNHFGFGRFAFVLITAALEAIGVFLFGVVEVVWHSVGRWRHPHTVCPFCGEPLPTAKANQCFRCGADWHKRVKKLPIRQTHCLKTG